MPKTVAGPAALEQLLSFKPDGDQVVSCYVRLEPEDRTRRKYLIELKDAAKAIRENLGSLERAARHAVERDLVRILEYLETPKDLPPTRGLALFASAPLKLFAAVPLPQVYRTRLAVDRVPRVEELIATRQEFGHVLVAVLDRMHARLFDVTALEAVELRCCRSAGMRGGKFHSDRQGSPGWGEAVYHSRIREEEHRHYELVAQELSASDREHPAHSVILAGPGTVPTTLLRFLPPTLSDRVIGTAKLNPQHVTPAMVYSAALAVREARERDAERALVTAVERGLGIGWAENGARQTLRALARGQVRTLIVRHDVRGSGFRCTGSGRLVLAAVDCGTEGEPLPVPDIVSEAIEEALRQRVSVVIIRDPEAAKAIDGLAALLRFR